LDNVLLGLAGSRLSRGDARQRAEEALAASRVGELASRKPGQLSGGEQQRVALARAIAPRPRFLLLDEPFASLDLITKVHLFEEIKALADNRNLTVVLVTHDPHEAFILCRSAFVLDAGRLVEAGPFESLLREPRSELLRLFQTHCQIPATPEKL